MAKAIVTAPQLRGAAVQPGAIGPAVATLAARRPRLCRMDVGKKVILVAERETTSDPPIK
jgi:hypothetical protein